MAVEGRTTRLPVVSGGVQFSSVGLLGLPNLLVCCIDQYNLGSVRRQFNFLELRVAADDDEVSGRDQVSRSAIDTDHAASRRAWNGVCREPATIVDVVNLDLLVLDNVGRPHQIRINRHTSFVMELCICHRRAVNFGFQKNSLHGAEVLFKSSGFNQIIALREILAKQNQFRASATGEPQPHRYLMILRDLVR